MVLGDGAPIILGPQEEALTVTLTRTLFTLCK